MYRPKSSYLGNPQRQVNYESKMFTTDVISIDKHMDNVEELISKYHNRPKSTDKIQKIGIDLNEKYKQMQRLQEQIRSQQLEYMSSHQSQDLNDYDQRQTRQFLQRNMSQQQFNMYENHYLSPKYQNNMEDNFQNQESFMKRYDSQYLQSQQKIANIKQQQKRLQSASTKYTYNNVKSSVQHSTMQGSPNKVQQQKFRLDSAKTQLTSPISRNLIYSSALMSQMSSQNPNKIQNVRQVKEQKKLQYSSTTVNLQKAAEYQQFFQKNANQAFGIAQCVITGKKIDTSKKQHFKEQKQHLNYKLIDNNTGAGAEAQIQTEEANTLSESDFIFMDQDIVENVQNQQSPHNNHIPIIEQSPKVVVMDEPNLIYQGSHVKIYKPIKEIQQRNRPQTAVAPQNKIKRRFINSNQKSKQISQNLTPIESEKNFDEFIEDQIPMKLNELNNNNIVHKIDYSKLESTFRNEYSLHKSIFRDKKQKIVELTEYLQQVLHDYQLENFKQNEKEVDQTLSKHNQTENNLASMLNTKRTFNNSIQEVEMLKSLEDSQVQSTGLRLRRLTAKYGPKVDLVSHGFQHFRVQDIEQFFDPLRLKLMMVPLSDIPNQYTKQGSDYYFIKGVKLQQMKELQSALNTYEEGIQEYPNSSYNCKFNKGVILFKLGMFKESLQLYRQISREEPLDKRIAYNKSLCEIQNGLYNQAVFTIDSYVNDYNERKHRYEKAARGDKAISYQEKIQMTKANYVPDDQFLYEIYQIRGVACLRANKVVEASRSFQVAHDFQSHTIKKQFSDGNQTSQQFQLQQSEAIHVENQQDSELKEDEEGFTVVSLEQTQQQNTKNRKISQQNLSNNLCKNDSGQVSSIRCEDQEVNSYQQDFKIKTNINKIRPITAKLHKSSSHQLLQHFNTHHLKQRLETLEEENDNYQYKYQQQDEYNNNQQQYLVSDIQTPITPQQYDIPDQQEDLFQLDADDIMKTLDNYDQEFKQISKDLQLLQQHNSKYKTQKIDVNQYKSDVLNLLNVNRNIDNYLDEERVKRESPQKHGVGRLKRTASDLRITNKKSQQHKLYFSNKNLLINIDKPQGAIQQFITYQKNESQKKQQDKEFKQKLQTYELENIQNKINTSKEYNKLKEELQREKQQQEGDFDEKGEKDDNIEEDILMRQDDFYIDSKRQIRLDKVLLGFEIDPLNDSITEQELEVRKRRQQIEEYYNSNKNNEKLSIDDLYMRRFEENQREEEQMKNKEYFLQFLKVQERDLGVNKTQKNLALNSIKELNEMQKKIGGIREYIDQTFADQAKTALNLDNKLAMAEHLNSLLEQTGQHGSLKQSSKLLESLQTTQYSHNTSKDNNLLDSVGDHISLKNKPKKITRRFTLDQVQFVIDQFDLPVSQRNTMQLQKILGGLKFFIKFPLDVRQQLYDMSILRKYNKGETIFNQGDCSDEFFVIVKGSVCVTVVKEELGNVPVNSRIAYDGDYVGELAYFEASDSLSPEIIDELHKQRSTTVAQETPTYVLQLNKCLASKIINSPALQSKYEKRINFLRELDIFSDIDMYILLPLASNILVKQYKMGEYIVKAGDLPEGLIIVKEGQCLVCAEKLAMRSTQPSEYQRLQPKNPNIKTNPTGSSHIIHDRQELKNKNQKHMTIKSNNGNYYSDSLGQVNGHHRTYQNEQILVDDKGRRMKDFSVYKDLMVFFNLLPKSYFGGRVLLPIQNKKITEDERRNKPSVADSRRRGAWFAGGHSLKQSSTNTIDNHVKQVLGDFEHLFIKRRYSLTTQKIMKNDRSSMLSVIANSSTVEVYIIDQQLLDFFPEHTQKQIWQKLMHIFEPDRPYMLKNVQKIKDKFREWDVYKVKSYQEQMKENYNVRTQHKQQQVVELDR